MNAAETPPVSSEVQAAAWPPELMRKLEAMEAQMHRLERRKEFEAEVTRALDRKFGGRQGSKD